jgi:hypothetical protein
MAEDWTSFGASYLKDAMQSWNSVPVTVKDSSGVSLITGIRATYLPFSQKVYDDKHFDGTIGVEIDQTSFVFRAGDVDPEIRLGYVITATINGSPTDWLVINSVDGRPWSHFDKHKQQIQVVVEAI